MAKKPVLQGKMSEIAEREPHFSILSDHPLADEGINLEDFNLNYHLGPIYDILRDPDTKPPVAIAIYGDWGTGKTTAMRWLEAMLNHWNDYGKVQKSQKRKKITVKPVRFCPWKYDNKEDVWRGLIAEVILASINVKGADTATITKAAKQFGCFLGKGFLNALSAVSFGIGPVKADGKDVASAIRGIVDEFNKIDHPEKAYLNEFESALEGWVKDTVKGDQRLALFVDDLDRCLPEVALEVLEALKLYLNIKKIIFVVGVDREIIEKLVEEHYVRQGFDKDKDEDRRKFRTYLEKIFQVEVYLGPTQPQIKDYLNRCLSSERLPAWGKYLNDKHQEIFRELIRFYGGRTPREIKRQINSSLRQGIGAIKVITTNDEQQQRQACAQGMQLYFIQQEIRAYPMLAGMLGDGDKGDKFFRTWSRVVIKNRKTDKDFPLTVELRKTGRATEAIEDEMVRKHPKIEDAEQKERQERYEIKGLRDEYKPIVENPYFKGYLYLLGNNQLGLLMQIPYPKEDSPLLSNAAIVSRKVEAETSDEQRILERVCREIEKSVSEVTDKDFESLERLDLSKSGISQFGMLTRLKGLKRLDLSRNGLAEVPPEIGNLTNLQWLHLDGNQMTEVPPEIGNLKNLQVLTLYVNQLTEVPPEIGKLTNLQVLYLYGNQLTEVPPEIGKLKNLQWLNLYGNQLTKVPPEIGKLTNLQDLYLDGNQLTEVPAELEHLAKNLIFLSLPAKCKGSPIVKKMREKNDKLEFKFKD